MPSNGLKGTGRHPNGEVGGDGTDSGKGQKQQVGKGCMAETGRLILHWV